MKTLVVLLSALGLGVSMAAAQTPGGSAYSSSSSCKTGESLATPTGSLPTGREGRKRAEPAPMPSLADGSGCRPAGQPAPAIPQSASPRSSGTRSR